MKHPYPHLAHNYLEHLPSALVHEAVYDNQWVPYLPGTDLQGFLFEATDPEIREITLGSIMDELYMHDIQMWN